MSKKIQRIVESVQLDKEQEKQVLEVVELTQKDFAKDRIVRIGQLLTCSKATTYTFDLKGLYDQIRLLYTEGKFSLVVRLSDVLLEYLPNEE